MEIGLRVQKIGDNNLWFIIVMSSSKNNSDKLQSVKQPKNVKVLILSESKTNIKEFYYIKNYVNLIKVDLSYNKLSSFPPGFTLRSFHSLKTLFLHYNKFNVIKNLSPITSCKSLIYLTLFGNPLEETKARHFIVNQMPSLMLMDNKIVKLQERDQEFNTAYSQSVAVPFPLIRHQNQQSTELYLQNMVKQLRTVRRKYVEVNPIVRLQRWWRHIYRKKHRKWKITQLPFLNEPTQTVYDLKHYKQNLDRLITEKMDIQNSNQSKIKSLFQGNSQFWKFFRQLIGDSQIYLTKQFCQLNAIKYSQLNQFKVFRYFKPTDATIFSKKRLLFFINYHNCVIASETKDKKQAIASTTQKLPKRHSTHKKIEYNLKKYQNTKTKLQKLEATYKSLVKPEINQEDIFNIIQKEYFKIMRMHIKGTIAQQFPVVCKKLLLRNLSAVKIQKWWRGCRLRKNVNTTKAIKELKAATKIQRWIRNLGFIHRFKFLLQASIYLKKERNSTQIILQMSQIAAIQSYCQYKEKGINFIVKFQQCSFVIEKSPQISQQSGINSKIIFHSDRKPYPKQVALTFRNQKTGKKSQKTNILEILFTDAKSIKSFVDSKGIKYVQFIYHSSQQTLNRKFILALKTYRMQKHQFVMSVPFSSGTICNTADWYEVVNGNKLVSKQNQSILDKKKQIQSKYFEKHRSYESLGSVVSLADGNIYLKVKFFLATINYSCFLVIKSTNLQVSHLKSKIDLINKKEYYLDHHKSFSKRYDDPTQNYSKISRNIISLDQKLPIYHQQKQKIAYPKILNTDQSHSIIQSITPQGSLRKFELEHKFQTYDRFDREVYPSTTQVVQQSIRYKKQLQEIQQLRHKKSIIDDIKKSHMQKIKDILTKKSQNLTALRGKFIKEQEENASKIQKSRLELQERKIKKHNLIKEIKVSSGNFQLEFMKKGIKSIKKDVKEVQKCRSFRGQQRQISQFITETHKKHQLQKTQIKEFSIKITQGDISLRVSENGKLKSQNDNQQQFYTKALDQRSHPPFKIKNQSYEASITIEEGKDQGKLAALNLQRQLKKARRKRLVHTVFPQQLYPLRQSNQIGFQLPKIFKK